jgi:hypothetical protein
MQSVRSYQVCCIVSRNLDPHQVREFDMSEYIHRQNFFTTLLSGFEWCNAVLAHAKHFVCGRLCT